MRKNIVDSDMPRVKICDTHIACCTPKATNTRSECVILIALPLQYLFAPKRLNVT